MLLASFSLLEDKLSLETEKPHLNLDPNQESVSQANDPLLFGLMVNSPEGSLKVPMW
jgi:hypothetical protein